MKPLLIATAMLLFSGCSNTSALLGLSSDDTELKNSLQKAASTSPETNALMRFEGSPWQLASLEFRGDTIEVNGIRYGQSQVIANNWFASGATLSMRAGRFVFSHNTPLAEVSQAKGLENDPLALGLHLSDTPRSFSWQLSWQPGNHLEYAARSTFSGFERSTLEFSVGQVQVIHVVETVVLPNIDVEYQNEYWIDAYNGWVLKTKQHLSPSALALEIELLDYVVGGL